MSKLTDIETKDLLQNYITTAYDELNVPANNRFLSPKFMGRIKRYPSIRSGYYVNFQNFYHANQVRKSKSEKYFRYTFRCIQFKNQDDHRLEVFHWSPMRGKVANSVSLWRNDRDKDGTFLEKMKEAMEFVRISKYHKNVL